MKLAEVAERLDCRLEGDGDIEITGVATLEEAEPGEVSFLSNLKYTAAARRTKASAIITGDGCPELAVPILRHQNPYLAFAKAIELFHLPPPRPAQIHPTAWVSDTARLGRGVSIGAYSVVGDHARLGDGVRIDAHCVISERVEVGEGTIIHAGCILREAVRVGRHCVLQNGAIIGADGFGFAKQADGSWYKIFQAGTVVIEDEVEIGAGSTIDRATLGQTVIRAGTKIDNLVQVGHGSSVGRNTLLCAQVGLAGSTQVGNNVVLAGQVGAAGHLQIGDGVVATAQTGIPASVEAGAVISGTPAISNRTWLKASAIIARLPELHKTIKMLENRIRQLETTLNLQPEAQDSLK